MTPEPTSSRPGSSTEKLEQLAFWLITAATGIYFSGGILPPLLHLAGLDGPADILLAAYANTCHQLSHRTLQLCETPFGLCARCIGFYGGLFAGALFATVSRRRRGPGSWVVLAIALVTLVDVVFSLSPETLTGNWIRLLLALPAGILLAAWALARLRATSAGANRKTLLEGGTGS